MGVLSGEPFTRHTAAGTVYYLHGVAGSSGLERLAIRSNREMHRHSGLPSNPAREPLVIFAGLAVDLVFYLDKKSMGGATAIFDDKPTLKFKDEVGTCRDGSANIQRITVFSLRKPEGRAVACRLPTSCIVSSSGAVKERITPRAVDLGPAEQLCRG